MVFSIFPVLREEFHFSNLQLGLVGSIFIWVYSLCMGFSGRVADLTRRDRVVVVSLVLWCLTMLGTAFSKSGNAFLFWRCMIGVTESLYVPAALGLIATLHPGETRSRALTIHGTASLSGMVAGGWYGEWMAGHSRW